MYTWVNVIFMFQAKNYFSSMLYNFVKVDIAYIILCILCFLSLNLVKLQYGEEIDTVLVFIFYGVSFFFSLFFVGAEY